MEEGKLSIEQANELVLEHQGWAISIAKSVARAWSLDYQLDGIDGAALEALIFCSRRFDQSKGVPFKGYARRRIHEASTEAAKKSRGWMKPSTNTKRTERLAREISAELFEIFPQLRSGQLPSPDGDDEGGIRIALQQLLVSASIISTRQGLSSETPEDLTEYKRVVELLNDMEPVHQELLWKVYWEGESLRGVADEWEIDSLNVIREHQVLLEYMQKLYKMGRKVEKPRIRPGLKDLASKFKRDNNIGAFSRMI